MRVVFMIVPKTEHVQEPRENIGTNMLARNFEYCIQSTCSMTIYKTAIYTEPRMHREESLLVSNTPPRKIMQ
jgi:hypothetical protein